MVLVLVFKQVLFYLAMFCLPVIFSWLWHYFFFKKQLSYLVNLSRICVLLSCIRLIEYEILYYNGSMRNLDMSIELDWTLSYEARDDSHRPEASCGLGEHPDELLLSLVSHISFWEVWNMWVGFLTELWIIFSPVYMTSKILIIFLSAVGDFWVLMYFVFWFLILYVRLRKYRIVFVYKLCLL